MNIEHLIERGRSGDEAALTTIYAAYHRQMKVICSRIVKDESVAEELSHDAFVLAFAKLGDLRDPKRFEPWLRSITTNLALRYKKRNKEPQMLPLSALSEEQLAAEPAAEEPLLPTTEQVMAAVEGLPEGYRRVFKMSVLQEMSHKEIAQILGIAAHSSSSQLTRARRMLQHSLARYWMLWLVMLLLPLTYYIIRSGKSTFEADKAHVWEGERAPLALPNDADTMPKHTPSASGTIITDSGTAIDSEETDSIGHFLMPLPAERGAADVWVIPVDTALRLPPFRRMQMPYGNPKSRQRRWQVMLAYGGNPSGSVHTTDDFLSVIDFASGGNKRSMRLHNWEEYYDYVNTYAQEMDTIDAWNMRQIAQSHASAGSDVGSPLAETKHHEPPKGFDVSLRRSLDDRWGIATGIGYTRMKSRFESGDDNTHVVRTQKLYYIGVPLEINYTLKSAKRWSIYASGGLRLDVPVRGKETTRYEYVGSVRPQLSADSLVYPTSHRSVHAPLQWSVGIGTGVQYQIAPHVNAYLEPHLQYYIPAGGGIETYRTEHPLNLSVPFGIRFTW